MAGMVIGKPRWEFVSGKDTTDFLKGVFQTCRAHNQAFEMPYRCDAPGICARIPHAGHSA